VAREDDRGEAPTEPEGLDRRLDRLGPANVREHLGRLVDRDDTAPARDERVRDPARPAAELEDLAAGGGSRVD